MRILLVEDERSAARMTAQGLREHGHAVDIVGDADPARYAAALEELLAAYREMGEDRDPREVERSRTEERHRAEDELFASLPRAQRAGAQIVARLAARFIPLRGVGKAAFLQCVDVARTKAPELS